MRTPSMTVDEAIRILGARGSVQVTAENRGTVRKWLSAQGYPALFAGGLSMRELGLAYNDTSDKALKQLRAKLDEAKDTADEITQEDSPQPQPEHKAPASNGHSNVSDGELLAHLIRQMAGNSVNPDQVRDIVRSELNGHAAPLRVEIVKHDGEVKPIEGTVHPMFPKLLQYAQARGPDGYGINIFLAGEASSGKTTACKQLAKALELPWHFNGAISMPHEMLGFIDAAGHYHRTAFREAYEHGGVYTFDEVDRSDAVALLAVNPHLANGVATFPDGQIKRHKDCIIICTANTWGTGASADYCGATKLDAAFMSRFPIRLAWDIDLHFEMAISGNHTWCQQVQHARWKAKQAGLKVMIDVRQTMAGAALIAIGATPNEAAEATYLANLTTAQRDMITGA